jgi:hypothetical protein
MRIRLASRAALLVLAMLVLAGPAMGAEPEQEVITITPEDPEITLYFLGSRDPQSQTITVVTSGQGEQPPHAVLDGDLTSTISRFKISMSEVSLEVVPTEDDDDYYLTATLSPTLGDLNAGEYTGTIKLRGKGYESSTVLLRAIFRAGVGASGLVRVILAIAVGLALGYLLKALGSEPVDPTGQRKATAAKKRGRWGKLKARWGPFVLGAATATLILVIGVDTQYLAVDTFGVGGFSDWLDLTLWGFAAAFSGKTITDYTTRTSARAADAELAPS